MRSLFVWGLLVALVAGPTGCSRSTPTRLALGGWDVPLPEGSTIYVPQSDPGVVVELRGAEPGLRVRFGLRNEPTWRGRAAKTIAEEFAAQLAREGMNCTILSATSTADGQPRVEARTSIPGRESSEGTVVLIGQAPTVEIICLHPGRPAPSPEQTNLLAQLRRRR